MDWELHCNSCPDTLLYVGRKRSLPEHWKGNICFVAVILAVIALRRACKMPTSPLEFVSIFIGCPVFSFMQSPTCWTVWTLVAVSYLRSNFFDTSCIKRVKIHRTDRLCFCCCIQNRDLDLYEARKGWYQAHSPKTGKCPLVLPIKTELETIPITITAIIAFQNIFSPINLNPNIKAQKKRGRNRSFSSPVIFSPSHFWSLSEKG